ncbi:alpha/beta-hydrolase [Podospora aff. communis PSN243]|uniref:Alpha/beta-hydrolase n=1 Tax=Podospora aff. communis PSN243 TaxID=3040156 RepID=A0AAV9GQC2_9PEZI|nr:alpha/beta-hydrolase [Podospora aff. communis PSN243]
MVHLPPKADSENCITFHPLSETHTHTIVLLHDHWSTADDFAANFFSALRDWEHVNADQSPFELFPTVKWVFPQAALLPLQPRVAGLKALQLETEDPTEEGWLRSRGLKLSVDGLVKLLVNDSLSVPRQHIFVGRIGQGFATVLATFFAEGQGGLAGLIGFNSWFPLGPRCGYNWGNETVPIVTHLQILQLFYTCYRYGSVDEASMLQTRIFLEHSQDDEVINISSGRYMRNMLARLQFRNLEWQEYEEGGHWINKPHGVHDLVAFLRRMIGILLAAEPPHASP